MADLYAIMKGKAHPLARVVVNGSEEKDNGGDLFATIMSDSDHPRQQHFLRLLSSYIPAEGHRQILLDGLAREYAGVDGWLAYIDLEG